MKPSGTFFRYAAAALIFFGTFAGPPARAGEHVVTDKFMTVETKANELGKKYGIENVLLAFDVDNTLVSMNQDLGSDQWFAWQSNLLKDPAPKGKVADSFGGLLDLQGKLFALSGMHTPEKTTAAVISKLQEGKFKMVLVTSRGSDFRNSTELALKKNGMDFSKTAVGTGSAGTYLPITDTDKFGLTDAEITAFDLKKPRPVSFSGGVYLTSGQHKGGMLKVLLKKLGATFKAIVYTDDQPRHHESMRAAFKDTGVDLWTIEYTAERAKMEQFLKADKKDVIQKQEQLQKTLSELFGT